MKSAKVINVSTTRKLTKLEIVQLVLLGLLLVAGFTTFFIAEVMPVVFVLFSAILLIMAWTNYKIRNRKIIAVVYVVFSIVTLVSAIMELL